MENQKKVVMALSGGMDSSTLLLHLKYNLKYDVHCIGFKYNSKHNSYEINAAKSIAELVGVPYKLIDLTVVFENFKSNLLKSGGDIPEGHYQNENMKLTVVPGRNTIFSSILLGYAESIEAQYISIGAHSGDHAIYSDCRKEYIKALDTVAYLASDRKVEVIAPFIDMYKRDILEIGYGTVSEKLAHSIYKLSRTCYKDQERSCGKCASCNERLEAFMLIGKEDPTSYS